MKRIHSGTIRGTPGAMPLARGRLFLCQPELGARIAIACNFDAVRELRRKRDQPRAPNGRKGAIIEGDQARKATDPESYMVNQARLP